MTHPTGMGVGVLLYPMEIPSGLHVESQALVVQHLYGHHKHGSYVGTYQFAPSQCKLFNIANCQVIMSTVCSQ